MLKTFVYSGAFVLICRFTIGVRVALVQDVDEKFLVMRRLSMSEGEALIGTK